MRSLLSTSKARDLGAERELGSGICQTRLWWFGQGRFYGLKQKKDRETCSIEKSIGDDKQGCSATAVCLATPTVNKDGNGALGL